MVAFEIGDLVWAKMKCFPPWPARVVEPDKKVKPPKVKEPVFYVCFFGTEDFAWITESNMHSFEDGKVKFGQKNVGKIKQAIQEMYAYAAKHPPKRKIIPTAKANGGTFLKPLPPPPLPSTSKDRVKSSAAYKRSMTATARQDMKKKRHSATFSPISSSTSLLTSRDSIIDDKFFKFFPGSKISPKFQMPKRHLPETSYYSPSTSPPPANSSKENVLDSSKSFSFYSEPSVESDVDEKKMKKILLPIEKKIGFLTYNCVMSCAIIKSILQTNHNVMVYNSNDKPILRGETGLTIAYTACEVVKSCDVIFSYLKDSDETKQMFYGNNGINYAFKTNDAKSFIQMAPIDPKLSQALEEAMKLKKCGYLDLQFLGTKEMAENGQLTLLAAGDENLLEEFKPCFHAMASHICYLGSSVGKAVKMNTLVNIITGSCYAAVAEAMALAERSGIVLSDVFDVVSSGDLKCPVIKDSVQSIVNSAYCSGNLPLQQVQRILHLALDIGEKCQLPLPVTSASHEVFKRAEQVGYRQHDASAIYMTCRF